MKRHKQTRRPPQNAEAIFRRRAERLQSECGWCAGRIGEDQPVFGIGGKALPGIDLSLVQGKSSKSFSTPQQSLSWRLLQHSTQTQRRPATISCSWFAARGADDSSKLQLLVSWRAN
jgi:hypothetical protein